MKKIFIFILCGVIVLGLTTGCGNSEAQNAKSKNSLASKVKIGDYVDYKTKADNKYTSSKEKTGHSQDQTFITTGEEKWRVLKVADDGTVTLISEEQIQTNKNDTYYLMGKNGYKNGYDELNNIAKIYGNGEYAVSSRHLMREDVNTLIGIEKIARYYDVDLSNYNTDEKKWNAIYSSMDENYGKELTSKEDGTTDVSNYYNLNFSDFEEDNTTYQSLLNGRYWLANQIIKYTSGSYAFGQYDYFCYGLGAVSSSSSSQNKFGSDSGYDSVALECSGKHTVSSGLSDYNRYIRPVVILDKEAPCVGGNGTKADPYTLK